MEQRLDTRREDFDKSVARMQTREGRVARDRLFKASPEELGRSGVAKAQRESGGSGENT